MKNALFIRYTMGQCSLGMVLVAKTNKGICHLSMDDATQSLVQHLYQSFPTAEIIEDSKNLGKTLSKVITFIEHPKEKIPVPLAMKGTAFQERVWKALLQTKPGETLTYTELAQRIGKPDAVRAVASANGANKIAVLIPCHRIIRSDGGLGGYRWGLNRKQILLNREAEQNKGHRLTLL